jgi:hypothetical protein
VGFGMGFAMGFKVGFLVGMAAKVPSNAFVASNRKNRTLCRQVIVKEDSNWEMVKVTQYKCG